MKKILIITGCTIGKNINHAGGVNAYNVISKIRNHFKIDLRVIHQKSEKTIKLSDICDDYQYVCYKQDRIPSKLSIAKILSLRKSVGMINKKTVNKVIQSIDFSKEYDIIWLHWTQCASLYNKLKKRYPNAKFVLFEEDVMFLNLQRSYKNERNFLLKFLKFRRFLKERKYEIDIAKKVDLIICTNKKDSSLLLNYNINQNKICVSPSYFQTFDIQSNVYNSNNIIFYGSMGRKENEDAVLWFLNNVFEHLDNDIRFYIIGTNPSDKIKKYSSNRIIVTGFVENPINFFADAFCVVCPLFLGAGIKIKSLQALSCGLPLVSTDVGIEGIDAVNGQDFILANNSNQFVNAINELFKNRKLAYEIGMNGTKIIKRDFDYNGSISKIISLLEK